MWNVKDQYIHMQYKKVGITQVEMIEVVARGWGQL
jgi:hypothetical protein